MRGAGDVAPNPKEGKQNVRWTDTPIGSALHDEAGQLLAEVRPLEAGARRHSWFATVPAAKRAIEEAIAA